MNILKLLLLAFVSMSFYTTCYADMLFWLLDNESYDLVKEENITAMTYLICNEDGDIVFSGKANNKASVFMSEQQFDFNWNTSWNKPEYMFMIELANDNNEKWISSKASYREIASSGAIRNLGIIFNTSYFKGFNDFQLKPIPEPSAGTFIAFGMCLILLKRRTIKSDDRRN